MDICRPRTDAGGPDEEPGLGSLGPSNDSGNDGVGSRAGARVPSSELPWAPEVLLPLVLPLLFPFPRAFCARFFPAPAMAMEAFVELENKEGQLATRIGRGEEVWMKKVDVRCKAIFRGGAERVVAEGGAVG